MTTVIIIVGCAAALVGSSFLFYHLGKKGVDAGKALSTANDAVNMVDTAFDTVKPFIPASPAVSIVGKIIDWAKAGTAAAEQLYKTSKIQGDERKAEATDFILNALKIEGITVTPEIQKMVDGAVEASVNVLPKTNGSATVYNQTVNMTKSVSPSEVAQQTKEAVKSLISQSDSAASTEAQNSADTSETTVKTVTDDAGKVVSQTACTEPAAESADATQGSSQSEAAPAAAQATADQQSSTAPAASADSSTTAGTGSLDALSAAAKVLTAGVILLNNAVSKTPDTDNAALTSAATAVQAAAGTAAADATTASAADSSTAANTDTSAAAPSTPAQA